MECLLSIILKVRENYNAAARESLKKERIDVQDYLNHVQKKAIHQELQATFYENLG